MRRLRLGPGLDTPLRVAPALPFPGMSGLTSATLERERATRLLLWIGLAGLLHASLLIVAFVMNSLPATSSRDEASAIPVQILRAEPVPDESAAPAAKARAESRSADFAPSAQAVAPQVINPHVVAPAAAAISAAKVEVQSVGAAMTPKNITTAPTVRAAAVSVVSAPAVGSAQPVNIQGVVTPSVVHPTQIDVAAGPSVGPKPIASASSTTIGTASTSTPVSVAGSSVKDGIVSNRDVLGASDGKPIGNVNTRVGDGLLHGPGGTGTGQGTATIPCQDRSEVKTYIESIKSRMYTRWVLPSGAPNHRPVKLAFTLDASGSLLTVNTTQSSGHAGLDQSAMDALRAASPFPAMSEDARCLAGTVIQGSFQSSVINP